MSNVKKTERFERDSARGLRRLRREAARREAAWRSIEETGRALGDARERLLRKSACDQWGDRDGSGRAVSARNRTGVTRRSNFSPASPIV
jgi:hypothetical protein